MKHEPAENTPASYQPLLVILIFCVLMSLVQIRPFQADPFMHSFMGYFFIFLSLFKFFDLNGFVDGFSTYDLIAKRFRMYGYAYPFIELALGLSYLAQHSLFFTYLATVIVMTVSGIGVVKSIFSGQKIKCACLGTVLNVPLSTVSVLENVGMGGMAAYQLLRV